MGQTSATAIRQRKLATYRALGINQIAVRVCELADAPASEAARAEVRDRIIRLLLQYQGAQLRCRKCRLAYRERPNEQTLARLTKARRSLDRFTNHLRIVVATERTRAA